MLERRFVRFLLERQFVYRTPSGCVLPYAKSANEGLFCVRDYYRNGHTGSYTLVTPKGKLHFAGLRGKNVKKYRHNVEYGSARCRAPQGRQ